MLCKCVVCPLVVTVCCSNQRTPTRGKREVRISDWKSNQMDLLSGLQFFLIIFVIFTYEAVNRIQLCHHFNIVIVCCILIPTSYYVFYVLCYDALLI